MSIFKVLLLGIESTAHTFGVSIIDGNAKILADTRMTMPFERGKGIHPQEAAEHHARIAYRALQVALSEANVRPEELNGISYSAGPGLGPVLRVGATVSRALASYLGKPIYPVHHGLGHVELTLRLTGAETPLVVLVSGGHTAITSFNLGRWRIYGETLDITLGNLLDQFARRLGLSFPGGPEVERLASRGSKLIDLPYTVKGNNVVYSGLLTHALNLLNVVELEDLCYSLQETAFSMLVEATERALVQLRKNSVVLTGGVAMNKRLRGMMKSMSRSHGRELHVSEDRYNPDNGVQIALVGLYLHRLRLGVPVEEAIIKQRWRLDEVDIPWRRESARDGI